MSSNKKSFVKGALILASANLIVKLIGAFFKIPLYELLGKEGSGHFNVAYQIYTFMFIIATAGFPIAVSKMVAESTAREDFTEAKRVFSSARLLLGIIGILGSLVLYVFADSLANLLNNTDAAIPIRAISPAVFFVALVSSYRGYFQGKQNMYPTAFSEVIEATFKLLIGIFFALYFMRMDIDPNLSIPIDFQAKIIQTKTLRTVFAASGAIFGVTIGTLCSLILMLFVSIFDKKPKMLVSTSEKSSLKIIKELVAISIPITIGASVSSLTSLVDLATIMNRLVVNPAVFDRYDYLFEYGTEFFNNVAEEGLAMAEILEKKANTLYGMYTGQAQTMFNLPLTIVVALGMSVVPAISALVEKKELQDAKRTTESALRLTMLFALPCAIGMSVLSREILSLLYSDSDAYLLLRNLSIAVIFVSIVSVSNSVLQAFGKVYYPVFNMLIGGAVKVIMNYNLIPVLGIDGAPVATNICYFVIAVLNLICIARLVKVKIKIGDLFIRPGCAALVMGAAAVLLSDLFIKILGQGRITTLFIIALAGIIYVIMIFLFGAVKEDDLSNIPMGNKIIPILKKANLLK